jgi:xanthine dehydrogenase molybdenum-binding subunit
MLYGRVLRSPYAHARIKRIDTSAAEAMGAICLTFEDVPDVRYNERLVSAPDFLYKDRYVLADRARHVGEGIAAVAAESEALAEKALRAIGVEWEPLPIVDDPHEAMQPGTAALYDSVIVGETETPIENNVAAQRVIEVGDIEQGFAEADVIIEQDFETPRIYHGQLETKAVVCRPEPDGGITVWPTTQTIHNTRILLGEIFDIPLSKINVKRVTIGGTFGSSIQTNSVIPICVALARKARRPVKIVSTREEDVHGHARYPSIVRLKLGAKLDGTLVAGHMRVVVDIGAHNIQAFPFISAMAGWWVSHYRLRDLKYEGTAVYTNKVPTCAMQGFANPQANFATESTMDMLAEELDMDPVELRRKNYVGLGDTFWGQGPTVKSIIQSCGVEETFDRGMELIDWHARPEPPEPGTLIGPWRRGIGMARGFHTSSAGAPRAGEVIDYSGAMVKLNEDGSVDVITALMDHGGGSLEALAKIAAETLGVPLSKVEISPADTRTTTYDVNTHATRGVYAGGGTVRKAAMEVRQQMLEYAADLLGSGVQVSALSIRPDEELDQGLISCDAIPDMRMTVREVAATARARSEKTFASVASLRQSHGPPAFVTHFIEVEINIETGQVRTLRVVIGADAGTVINPGLAAGQLEGSLSRGMGYALLEDTPIDPQNAQPAHRGFLVDAKLPTSGELLPLEKLTTFFVDTYEPTGPFGAKGLGEASINSVAAAYANAIYNAIGIRFCELPITPEKILQALHEQEVGTHETVTT